MKWKIAGLKAGESDDLANAQALEPNIGLSPPFNLHDVLHPRLAVLRHNSNRDDINPNDKIDLNFPPFLYPHPEE